MEKYNRLVIVLEIKGVVQGELGTYVSTERSIHPIAENMPFGLLDKKRAAQRLLYKGSWIF
jgi:hypothetical protein